MEKGSQSISVILGEPRPKGGPQFQVIGAEGADKTPNLGAKGAQIVEKSSVFKQKPPF